MAFIEENFLLSTESARTLYQEYAADQPIIDYHCHLPPVDISSNRQFANLHEIWLEGDHYKWRAMRANGVDESLCTGNASPKEKFLAWAKTVPHTLRNPLYHWTHLELKRYFGIDTLLSEDTAEAIWNETEERLATDNLRVNGILDTFKVKVIGTTDDPTDDLGQHEAISKTDCPAKVVPSFRPDAVFKVENSETWNQWISKLEAASGISCDSLDSLKQALDHRIAHFDSFGCRASDHGLDRCPGILASDSEIAAIFDAARSGADASGEDAEKFATHMLLFLGERYAQKDWAMQLHLGAMRSVNTHILNTLGPDKGCDSVGDFPQGKPLATILATLADRETLPKTVLYNLNPSDNYLFATMCGNFAEGGKPGKMQFGSGWWFLDQIEGMTLQINALSNLGLLSRFIGMLTDSRSFMSFPRHEYFRRLLCDLLGNDIEAGLIPKDYALVGNMVSDICYRNAKSYFGF